ncbi:MAG: hypothetical protein LBL98_03575 [Ruminococcus sp.]|jgi:hypothetical protein|nr:hypothetical protein [Ruminococcus sp.]
MASEYELALQLTDQYLDYLTEIELFDLKYPDNVDGHNVLVKLASKTRKKALSVGLKDIDPLPPLK